MTPRISIYFVLFVLSEVAGVLLGEWFFRLYLKALPPVASSQFNTDASHIAHLLYGAGVGIVIFVFTMVGATADGMVRAMSKKPTGPKVV